MNGSRTRGLLLCRTVVACALAAGCGGNVDVTVNEDGCGDGAPPPTAATVNAGTPDGGTPDAGDVDAGAPEAGTAFTGTCQQVAGSLAGLRWELPCTSAHNEVNGCDSLPAPVTTTATAGGEPGTIYDLVLRFRGVVEERTYTGWTQSGYWYVGGDTPDRSDPFNIYSLAVSSPTQQYYLNAGTSYVHNC